MSNGDADTFLILLQAWAYMVTTCILVLQLNRLEWNFGDETSGISSRVSLISGVADRICPRTTAFHCRSRKYAINFCLGSPRGNANTRGDFAGVIRKCRGIPRALCCLSQLSRLFLLRSSVHPSPLLSLSLSLSLVHPSISPSLLISLPLSFYLSRSKCFALTLCPFPSTCTLNWR